MRGTGDDEEVRFEQEDGVATITLNRPDHLNAVTGTMLERLGALYRRVDADDAKWGVVQTRRGVVPDAHSHWTIPRVVGLARAAEILIAGKSFLGSQAAEFGIVNAALESTEVLAAARTLAADLATNVNPLSAALSKRILWQSAGRSAEEIDELERLAHLALMGRPDAVEGPRAFLERRSPRWESRVTRDWPEGF